MGDAVKFEDDEMMRDEDLGDLVHLCGRLEYLWYVADDQESARRHAGRLDKILKHLDDPSLAMAIVVQNATAWSHQLKSNFELALYHRRNEIKLIEHLIKDTENQVAIGTYNQDLADYVLRGYGPDDLKRKHRQANDLQEDLGI